MISITILHCESLRLSLPRLENNRFAFDLNFCLVSKDFVIALFLHY